METPNSSMRRVTRSQPAASINKNTPISKLVEESEQILSKSRQGKNVKHRQQQESNNKYSALLDITNNSPIVGLAAGSLLTPSSSVTKKRINGGKVMTPGSGEALLRGQVKTLLQKVEEEAELSKIETRPIFPYLRLGFVSSPVRLLLAPAPANTPQVLNLSEVESAKNDGDSELETSSVNPDQGLISQAVNEMPDGKKHEESLESHKSPITRSLLPDFSEKSEIAGESDCSCVLSWAEGDIEVRREEEEKEKTEEDNERECSDEEEEEECEGSVEELCMGMEKMSIMAAKFEGKHTRFVYDSDDEIVGGEEGEDGENGEGRLSSPSIVRLKGMPTPRGKHLRFPLVEED